MYSTLVFQKDVHNPWRLYSQESKKDVHNPWRLYSQESKKDVHNSNRLPGKSFGPITLSSEP
jgi:hypothetical protein